MSNYKSRIDEQEARRTRLSNCVADGFEFRDLECDIKYNSPKDGIKQIIRKDKGEVVEEFPMTPEELQEEMDFKEKRAAEAEAGPMTGPPRNGLIPIKLMWSVNTMKSPGRNFLLMPPAAFVSSKSRMPNAASARTANVTHSIEWPS